MIFMTNFGGNKTFISIKKIVSIYWNHELKILLLNYSQSFHKKPVTFSAPYY